MACAAPAKDAFDYLTAATPICIAAFVAWMAYRQSKINEGKLRLDLYNKRFEVYSRTLDFYHALLDYGGSDADNKHFKALHNLFIKSYRESQFLFEHKDGIYTLLGEMHTRSFKITGCKDHGKELAEASPEEYVKMYNESQVAMQWFGDSIPKLEKAMERYLNFHKIAV
jgi:hypothetical protein